MDSAPAPVFNVKAFAVGGNEKPEGYEACVYYTPEANMKNTQLIVSQVGDDTNWKMCMDASVISHSGLQVKKRTQCVIYHRKRDSLIGLFSFWTHGHREGEFCTDTDFL